MFFLNDLFIVLKSIFHVFFSFFWSVDSLSYGSTLDLFFSSLTEPLFFVNAFFLDMLVAASSLEGLGLSFVFVNFTDFTAFFPELLFFTQELQFMNIYLSVVSVAAEYDSFLFNTSSGWLLDYVVFFTWLVLFLFLVLAFTSLISFGRLGSAFGLNFYILRFFMYANNFAYENRLQLDWVLFFLFFSLIVWVPLLMTYDDVNVEVVELVHSFICLFFMFIVGFLLYKYSIHYFAFLENTVSDGYSTAYILKQFVRDISNTFALFLRFFLLLFRLNIYDGLDDFLDSYYIFFIDFDEDSYFDELFVSFDFLFYFSDNREDVVFYKPLELDW